MTAEEVIRLLEQEYGPLECHPTRDPVEVLINTILSQNTSDLNSGRAFNSLLATFGGWEAIASAPVDHIAQAIKSGGLYRVKAARIKQALNKIQTDRGRISLDFIKSLSTSEAKDYLTRLPGVGPKTASCVLLFSLGKPSLPVDTHIFRVAKRLGLIDPKVSIEKASDLLQEQIPPSKVCQFHVHMIEHGRQVCRARQPRCHECIFKEGCPGSLVSATRPTTHALP